MAVSILDFTGDDVSPKILRACYQKLETSLFESNRFTVIAKNQREQILEEMKFQSSGMCNEECAVEIGQLVGAEYLMLGEIIGFGKDFFQINIKIVNIEKGDVAEKVTKEIEGKLPDLLDAMAESSREITRRITSGREAIFNPKAGMEVAQKKFGTVIIESNPPGANVFIDDVVMGFTPIELSEVEVGTRRLMLVKPGFEVLNKGVIVNEEIPINVSEVLIPQTGSLTILTEPSGAIVYLNEQAQGNTPLDIPGIKVGDVLVTVRLDNYEEITQRVTVEYRENNTKKFNLKPLPGTINLIVSPSRAEITINKKKYRPNSSGIASIQLATGSHKIEFSANGYEFQEKTISLGANEKKTLEVTMKKRPAGISSNPDMGFLTINTVNIDAKVKISRVKRVQALPLEYFELKYGTYKLKAFKDGFESKKVTVDIERQKTAKIDINLDMKIPEKALKYSAMAPGSGQFYANRTMKGIFFSTATIGLTALLGNTILNYQDENALVSNYQKDYQNATSQSDIESKFRLYNNQVASVNNIQNQLVIYGGSLVATYLINIIDARFFSGL